MSEALVIRLGRDSIAIQYLLVDAAGGRLGAVIKGPLSQAATLAANRRVIALIPAVDVVLAEPELPAKNAARLAQLAPYALEEQLVTDIDAMHFAVGKREASGKTPVAAVLRENMERWLAEFAQSGIHVDAVYAESSLLPATAGGATLILDHELLYVRRSGVPSFALDAQPLEDALQLALGVEGSEQLIGELQFYASQADYERQGAALEQLRGSLPGMQIKLLPEGPLPLFALQISQNSPLDFLCGPYERKSPLSNSLAPWRYAAVLLGVALALQLTYNGVRLWQAVRAEKQLDAQIHELATQIMPGLSATDTRDARRQFEARLGVLKQGGGRSDLLSSLATLRDALAQNSDARVEALFYRTQTLDLRVTAANVDALGKIQQAATASGFATQIQSVTPRDNKVEGRLQLKL